MKYKRMEKLADFLDKLPRRQFYFGDIIDTWDWKKGCGSVCCAIGWTPMVFPKFIKWTESKGNVETEKNYGYVRVAAETFGITPSHAKDLFTPGTQVNLNLNYLNGDSTPKQVAKMLRKYMKKVRNGDYKEKSNG